MLAMAGFFYATGQIKPIAYFFIKKEYYLQNETKKLYSLPTLLKFFLNLLDMFQQTVFLPKFTTSIQKYLYIFAPKLKYHFKLFLHKKTKRD